MDEAKDGGGERALAGGEKNSAGCMGRASRRRPRPRAASRRSGFDLPRSAFEDLNDGVAMDLSSGGETFEALRYYLRVASAVGLICVEIFGYAISVRATTRSSSALRCS